MNNTKVIGFRFLIASSILLTIFLLVGQTFSLFNYEAAVARGLQESTAEIGEVGIAFAKGFAFGDTVIYIPLLMVGIFGLLKRKKWGYCALFGSLAISVYWPLVHLYAIYIGQDAIALLPEKYISFSVILPIIAIYGLWGMWYLYENVDELFSFPPQSGK